MIKRDYLRILAFCIVSAFIFFGLSSAETIILKSGTTVKANILNRAEKYVKVNFHGVPLNIYLKEIETIDGEKILPKEVKTSIAPVLQPGAFFQPPTGRKLEKGRQTVINLKDKAMKISLPREWINLSRYADDAETPTAVFVRDRPRAEFDIFVQDLGDEPGYSDRPSLMKFLDEKKLSLQKDAQALGYEWISDSYDELFNVPCLIVTYGNIRRDIQFVKDSRLYTVRFRAKNREDFDKEWPAIENSVRNLRLI